MILLHGIHEVRFIPDLSATNILPMLNSSIDKSESMRAAIGYWTVDSGLLHSSIVNKLKPPKGFLCVDFHLPTNISELCRLKIIGADVYLHLTRLIPHSGVSQVGMPPHLMHTKLIIFDFSDNISEIWVGSHNWTPRALQGINIEASIVLHVETNSNIYQEAENYLNHIKNDLCSPIDPRQEDYYKKLQGEGEDIVASVELEGLNVSSISGSTINIFGTDSSELTQVNRVGRQIIVSVMDSTSSAEYIYYGEILHSGVLAALNPSAGGISFSQRRYAFRRGRSFPRLEPVGVPPDFVINNAAYFITIELKEQVNAQLLDPPEFDLWVDSWQDTMTERLDYKIREKYILNKTLFQVPANWEDVQPKYIMLEQKRETAEYPLVKRKIIKWL